MRVIHMKDDFIVLCNEIKEIGPFEAYKRYTMKYPELFDKIFEGLYMIELDNLKPMIETIDYQRNLETAQKNYRNGIPEKVCNIAKEVIKNLDFYQEFDIYFGLELGNINGFSGPNLNGRPFIYIGLDIELEESTINYLIPHEINHMIRINTIKDIDMFDFQERVISEGLGVYCPIVLNNLEFTDNAISKALNLSIKEVVNLNSNVELLISKVAGEFGSKLTNEKMSEYFTWSESDSDGKYLLSGYYVGMIIIRRLVEKGYNLSELTITPSNVIWERYKSFF